MKIEHIKRNLGKQVRYKNSRNEIDTNYLFTGCTLRRSEKGLFYQAELQDLNSNNSILICKLEDIEAINTTE